MFTLKFYRQDGMQETVVSAQWYEVFGGNGRYTIVTHAAMPCANGVGFEISNLKDEMADNHYSHCYIENMHGKTIGCYKCNEKTSGGIVGHNESKAQDEASGD